MRSLLVMFCVLAMHVSYAQGIRTGFEATNGKKSPEYHRVMKLYKTLAEASKKVSIKTVGQTDTDEPLSVVFYSPDGKFSIKDWRAAGKVIILINNGIHPGEPDGISACTMLLRDAVEGKVKIPGNVVLAVVPVFNISGLINMRPHSRANQDGPEVAGFRGNAQNLDLNRDFIKTDARETRSMIQLFQMLDPDILIDNHVSNGADYQHVMTLLSTQHNKLGGPMGDFLNTKMEPAIYKEMKTRGYDLVPYVNVWGTTPDKGWPAFLEIPRFFSGYAAMFNTYAFVAETHMLKPFPDRVKSTYALMESFIQYSSEHADEIIKTRNEQKDWISKSKRLDIDWKVDTTKNTMITFKGYEGGYKPSDISGKDRLYYDRSKPYTMKVPFYNTYYASERVKVPRAYIIQQGWHEVVDQLRENGVQVRKLPQDTTAELTVYYIEDYETAKGPYEGHYLHSNVTVRPERKKMHLRKGDFLVHTNQPARRYIVETLEPTAPDAFFAWGFFDAVLQQKEYYSSYVFEDLAVQLLDADTVLKNKFEYKKENDTEFAEDGAAQLRFIYQNSSYHEPEHMRYPAYRLE